MWPNQSLEPTGGSRLAQPVFGRQRWLPQVALRSFTDLASILALVGLLPLVRPGALLAADYTGYAALPEIERDRIVWDLHEHDQWGRPEQKPICRDLLETQGHSFANQIAWTCEAIDLTEKQGWKDLSPLISRIYERPKNIWVYERAFRYLRVQVNRPVSTNIVAAAQILELAAGPQVSEAQLSAAKTSLLGQTDKEAVLVYAIKVAGWHPGKGATERGRKAACEVLDTLDRATVAQRLRQLAHNSSGAMRGDIEWIAKRLGIALAAEQK